MVSRRNRRRENCIMCVRVAAMYAGLLSLLQHRFDTEERT